MNISRLFFFLAMIFSLNRLSSLRVFLFGLLSSFFIFPLYCNLAKEQASWPTRIYIIQIQQMTQIKNCSHGYIMLV